MRIKFLLPFIMFFSFIIVLFSTAFLVFAPDAQSFLWVDRSDYTALVVYFSFIMSICSILLFFFYIKPIFAFLNTLNMDVRIFKKRFMSMLILVILTAVLITNDMIKKQISNLVSLAYTKKTTTELETQSKPSHETHKASIKSLASELNMDAQSILAKLKNAGLEVENEDSLIDDIAKQHNITPSNIYSIIEEKSLEEYVNKEEPKEEKPAVKNEKKEDKKPETKKEDKKIQEKPAIQESKPLEETKKEKPKKEESSKNDKKLAKLTLKQVSEEYDVELEKAIRLLKIKGLSRVNKRMKMSKAADELEISPSKLLKMFENQ